jgi:hypothetical protein
MARSTDHKQAYHEAGNIPVSALQLTSAPFTDRGHYAYPLLTSA